MKDMAVDFVAADDGPEIAGDQLILLAFTQTILDVRWSDQGIRDHVDGGYHLVSTEMFNLNLQLTQYHTFESDSRAVGS